MKLIKKVKIETKKCFDLTILDTNTFFVNNILVHNSNMGVIFEPISDTEYGFYTQSRERIIVPGDDNAGGSAFINTKPILELLNTIEIPGERPIIKVYGEWCGKGIQAKVGITKLDKMFVIFAVKIGEIWLAEDKLKLVKLPEHRIFNICDFPSYRITIDFNDPKPSAEKMGILVESVEKECPVAKAFGVEGIGEGIVWTPTDEQWIESRFWFKTKGDEHKNVKSKEKVPVDIERVNSIKELVETIVGEARLEQGLDHLRQLGLDFDRKNLGVFIKWVYNDVIKEELDTIMGNGFEPKDISGEISNKARLWFFKKEEEML